MALTEASVAIGVFRDYDEARQAIDDLRRAGFTEDEVGFLTRARVANPQSDVGTNTTTGAVSGGVVGGVLGAAAALLIPGFGPALAGGILAATLGGAALGAAAGGLIGTFTSMGVTEKEARFYQQELEAGHTIVTVKAPTGHEDALEILRRNGAYDATTQEGVITARAPIRPYGETYDPDTDSMTDEVPHDRV